MTLFHSTGKYHDGMQPTYTIRPRPTRDGYDLNGPGLAFGLWFREDTQAVSHAEHCLRGRAGRIAVLRSDGSTELYWHHQGDGRREDSMGGLR